MAGAKIEIKVGGVSFAGEGDEKWLSEQLDKLLAKAGDLAAATDSHEEVTPENTTGDRTNKPAKSTGTLASFLTAKAATTKQVRRFLATAEWLTLKGQANLSTSDVTKALSENHQSKLSNPADCLNKNVAKGYCEKKGNGFYVTPEGREELN